MSTDSRSEGLTSPSEAARLAELRNLSPKRMVRIGRVLAPQVMENPPGVSSGGFSFSDRRINTVVYGKPGVGKTTLSFAGIAESAQPHWHLGTRNFDHHAKMHYTYHYTRNRHVKWQDHDNDANYDGSWAPDPTEHHFIDALAKELGIIPAHESHEPHYHDDDWSQSRYYKLEHRNLHEFPGPDTREHLERDHYSTGQAIVWGTWDDA